MSNAPREDLFENLRRAAGRWKTINDWPQPSLEMCGRHGVFRDLAGVPGDEGDRPPNAAEQIETLVKLAKADLLTTFVITQHVGAIKRILASDSLLDEGTAPRQHHHQVISRLLSGQSIASVGISHLTTSRLHLGRPAVRATACRDGYVFEGTIPWVTGAPSIEWVVVGAALEDQSQILALISLNDSGVRPGPGAEMVSMSASCTDAIELDHVMVNSKQVLSGPRENVLVRPNPSDGASADSSGGAGGLQTSALALGLSSAALDYLADESQRRDHLRCVVNALQTEHHELHSRIVRAADGTLAVDPSELRTHANSLVQRTTSAAMTAAKGAGLLANHPASRWCAQSLFFLVWSCPQGVAEAHLCELAGID